MVYFTPCKINLGLHILSRRPDGYRNIETCFYPVPWQDILELLPAGKLTFTLSGLPVPGKAEDNLCRKAYSLIKKDFDIPPVQLHLHKVVPVGAGLGGGSSDAAATLKALNQIFSLGISEESLQAYAAQLGSDCPFFIRSAPVLGTGKGEVLTPLRLTLKEKFLVLVNPGIPVLTAEAYRDVIPQNPKKNLAEILKHPVTAWRELLFNDFEASVFLKHPGLRAIKEKLYKLGALYAAMSGSGSTVFGLFDQANDFRKDFPGLQVWSDLLPR